MTTQLLIQPTQLTREDLYSLEQYNEMRDSYRKKVMAHKLNRRVSIGPNVSLIFEDRLTMQYQVQEMLRAEKIFVAEEIQEELDAYNPMIPTGSNWKATLMIEYSDPVERAEALSKLLGVDSKTWVEVNGYERVYPISNEDLERETENKTSSVHFMRFELSDEMVSAAKQGAAISVGIEHDFYNHSLTPVTEEVRRSLVADLS